jgi:hypothetical protein
MKKLIFMTALAVFGAQFANAQFSKGNVMLGGNLNVATSSDKHEVGGADAKTSSTSFGISPKVGVALNEKWMIGIFADTHFGSVKDLQDKKTKTTSIAPGIFVRNYHMIGNSNFAFFGEANAAYKYQQSKLEGEKTSDANGFKVAVAPGLSYFVTKKFMIEGMFGGISYANNVTKAVAGDAKTTSNKFSFDFPKEFKVGVNFIF